MDEGWIATRPWLPGTVGTLVVVAAWLLFFPDPPLEPDERPLIVVHPPTPQVRPPFTLPEPEPPGVRLVLDPPDWPRKFHRMGQHDGELRPYTALAALENPRWPAVASIEALLAGVPDKQAADALDQADREGLTAEAALTSRDPWRILATLEVERLRQHAESRRRIEAWEPPPGPRSGFVTFVPASVSKRDWTTLRALTRRLARVAKPQREVADLYDLYALIDEARGPSDHDPARALAISILRATDEPATAREAVRALLSLSSEAPELADEFPALADEFPQEALLVRLAVGTAILSGQFDVAGYWVDRTLSEGACGCVGLADEAQARCRTLCSVHHAVGPELAAAGWSGVATWDQRLQAAVLTCCTESFKAEGQWESGWTWTSSTDPEAAACISQAADAPPFPDAGQRVKLIVAKSTSVDLSGGRGVPLR